MDVFQALEIFSASWKATSKEVIQDWFFWKAGIENGVAATSSAPEVHDSMEDNEGTPFTSHTLAYGEEDDQVSREEAWRCLESDGVIPDCVALEKFLIPRN